MANKHHHTCPACEFEAEFGTEVIPFPLDDRLHRCEGVTPFSWKVNPVMVERERIHRAEENLERVLERLGEVLEPEPQPIDNDPPIEVLS